MNRKTLASTAERVARAFAVAFVGALVLSGFGTGGVVDMSLLQKAALAGLAAVLNLGLSLLGTTVGNPASPSLLPAAADPATPQSPVVSAIASPVLRGDWADGSSQFANISASPLPFSQNLASSRPADPDRPPPEDCPTLAWRYQR